jgi:hypothetical protein
MDTTQITLHDEQRDINGNIVYGNAVAQERILQAGVAVIRKTAKYRGPSGTGGTTKLANEREILQALIKAGWLPPSAYDIPTPTTSDFEEGSSFPEGYTAPSAD